MRTLFGSHGGGSRRDVLITAEAGGSLVSDKDQEARVTYRRAKKQGAGQKRKDSVPRSSRDNVRGDGQTLTGFNPRTGLRNR